VEISVAIAARPIGRYLRSATLWTWRYTWIVHRKWIRCKNWQKLHHIKADFALFTWF